MPFSARDIARQINAEIIGDHDAVLTHAVDLENGNEGGLSFAANVRYLSQLKQTKSTAVIVTPELAEHCPALAIVSADPYLSFALAAQILHPVKPFTAGIHPTAVISDACELGDNIYIGPHVVIEAKCKIGDNSYIGAGSVISAPSEIGAHARWISGVTIAGDTIIGERVTLHPGVVIGSDGFGLANDRGVWRKIPQLGKVIIGDDVEIGANTTIDRGALLDTVIEQGVKLDNQIQVAHNVKIGAHSAIAGCVGIAGSATIGKHCAIGGGAGIQGHIEITDGVQVTGMTKISQSIKSPGVYTSGTAAQDNKNWIRNAMRFKDLDKIVRRLQRLEKDIG